MGNKKSLRWESKGPSALLRRLLFAREAVALASRGATRMASHLVTEGRKEEISCREEANASSLPKKNVIDSVGACVNFFQDLPNVVKQ